MRYYAANNYMGDHASMGFANTWEILIFQSRESRSRWVREMGNISTRAINRSEIRKYIGEPWTRSENNPFTYRIEPMMGSLNLPGHNHILPIGRVTLSSNMTWERL